MQLAVAVKSLLAVLVVQAPPGRSIYSAEVMPECGTDPAAATCALERVCDRPSLLCAPPRYSKARQAWVRCESPEAAVRRYALVTGAIVRQARRLTTCRADGELPDEDCTPIRSWPTGAWESLAMAGAVTAVGESGVREDVQGGYAPMGRGTANEAGMAQLMPNQIPQFAGWLPKEERERLAKVSAAELETWIQTEILGEKNLDHYWEAALRALASARASCAGSGASWTYSMWSRFGTGSTCKASGKFAMQRSAWYATWMVQKKTAALPEWAEVALSGAPAPALVAAD